MNKTGIEDLIAMNALYRPGPEKFIPDFIEGKKDASKIKYLCPQLEPILSTTYGQIVYQEQVMQIVRDLAGYTWGRSDLVRRAMSKKHQDEIDAERSENKCLKLALNILNNKHYIPVKFFLAGIFLSYKKYQIFKGGSNMIQIMSGDTFVKQDVRGLLKGTPFAESRIAEIFDLNSNKEDKKAEYKQFINTYIKGNEDVILLTRSLISETEFPPDKWCLDYQKNNPENAGKSVINDREVIQRENRILEEIGFVSINDYVGYEYGDAYIYPNKAGKTVLEAINNVTKKEKPLNA